MRGEMTLRFRMRQRSFGCATFVPLALVFVIGGGCIESRSIHASDAEQTDEDQPNVVQSCSADHECPGPNDVCSPFLAKTGELRLTCNSATGSARGGMPCSAHAACRSGVCMQTGGNAFCFEACIQTGDCLAAVHCEPVEFKLGDGLSVAVNSCAPASSLCKSDVDCDTEEVCLPVRPAIAADGPVMACLPKANGWIDGGKACTADHECSSGMCLELPHELGRFCYSACEISAHCPPGLSCSPNSVYFSAGHSEDDPASNVVGLSSCTPYLGALTACQSDQHCLGDEACSPYSNSDVSELQPMCTATSDPGELTAGAPCQVGAQCRSGHCLELPFGGYCLGLCSVSSDCAAGATCRLLPGYVVNDFGDKQPANDLTETISLCLP